MKKLDKSFKYVGEELHLFKDAINWKSYFSNNIRQYVSGEVLEVGAGIGSNTFFLSRENNRIKSWTIIEPDSNLIPEIEINTKKIPINNITIKNGTINCLKEEKYDCIIYIDVLEHIEKSILEIELAKSHLKKDGILIILVPAYQFLYNNFDKSIGHYRRYSKRMLLKEVNSNLTLEKIYYLDSIGFFASLVNKTILKKDLPSLSNIRFWDQYLVRISILFDRIFFRKFGKSLIGIFRNK
ncbi:MAG: methyltransferase domain-containing protein [Cellulophaga sp.]